MTSFKNNVTNEQQNAYLEKYPAERFFINQRFQFEKKESSLERIAYCKDSLLLLDSEDVQVGRIISYISNKINIQFIYFDKTIETEEKIEFILDTIELLVGDDGLALNHKDTVAGKTNVLLFNSKITTAKKITYCLYSTFLLQPYGDLSEKLRRSLDGLIKTLGEDIKKECPKFRVHEYKQSQTRMVIDNLAHCFNYIDENARNDFNDAKIIKILMKFLLDDKRIHGRKEAAKAIGNLVAGNEIYINHLCNPEVCKGVFNLITKMTGDEKETSISNDFIEQMMYLVSKLSVGFFRYFPLEQNAILNFIFETLEVKYDRTTSMKKIHAVNACGGLTTIEREDCNQNLIPFYENIFKYLVILLGNLRQKKFEENVVLLIIKLLNKDLRIEIILDSGVVKLINDANYVNYINYVNDDRYKKRHDDYLKVKTLLQFKGCIDVFNSDLQQQLCINSPAGGEVTRRKSGTNNSNKRRKTTGDTCVLKLK